MKIEVIKDTKVIEDNTADSLAVKLIEEQTVTEYIPDDKTRVTGDAIKVEKFSYVNLGNLKQRKVELEAEIAKYQNELTEVNTLISSVEPEIVKAIDEILLDEESVDNRKK